MVESTVDVTLKIRVSVKTEDDPCAYTIKQWKMLIAKKIRQTIKNTTLENISKDIRSYCQSIK